MTKTTGSLWIEAKFAASWKSPGLVEASPPNAKTTHLSSLRLRRARARPTAWGNSVPTSTERERTRRSGELNMLSIARPAEFVSVAFPRTARNSSSAVLTNAKRFSRSVGTAIACGTP